MEIKNSCLTKKCINLLMADGKKSSSYKTFFLAGDQFLRSLKKGSPKGPGSLGKERIPSTNPEQHLPHLQERRLERGHQLLPELSIAVKNVQPSIEGRKCRIAGSTKLIPSVVSKSRGETLALRWIIQSARKRRRKSKNSFYQCLAHEFLDAYQKCGVARSRRDEIHKLCSANRGFLRYRWW